MRLKRRSVPEFTKMTKALRDVRKQLHPSIFDANEAADAGHKVPVALFTFNTGCQYEVDNRSAFDACVKTLEESGVPFDVVLK